MLHFCSAVNQLTNLNSFMELAESGCPRDTPAIYGLDDSTQITYCKIRSQHLLQCASHTIPDLFDSGSALDWESSCLATMKQILRDLPQKISGGNLFDSINLGFIRYCSIYHSWIFPFTGLRPETNNGTTTSIQSGSPMAVFYEQEVCKLNNVIHKAQDSLELCIRVSQGKEPPSAHSVSIISDVRANRVPNSWTSIGWNSPSLKLWIDHLNQRYEALNNVINKGKPIAIWMCGIFNTKALLNAILQEAVRKVGGDAKVDEMEICYEVSKFASPKSVREPPKEGVLLYGLSLEGGAWDSQSMKLIKNTQPTKTLNKFPVSSCIVATSSIKNPSKYSRFCLLSVVACES